MEDLGSIPGLGRSLGGGHGNPLQHSYLENPHGQRSLVGYSSWGRKELDTTERLNTAQRCQTYFCFSTICFSPPLSKVILTMTEPVTAWLQSRFSTTGSLWLWPKQAHFDSCSSLWLYSLSYPFLLAKIYLSSMGLAKYHLLQVLPNVPSGK